MATEPIAPDPPPFRRLKIIPPPRPEPAPARRERFPFRSELPVIMFDTGNEMPTNIQPWYISHAETIAQNVGGQIIAFFILWVYGITGGHGLAIQATFLIAAYIRGYAIRRWFEKRKLK